MKNLFYSAFLILPILSFAQDQNKKVVAGTGIVVSGVTTVGTYVALDIKEKLTSFSSLKQTLIDAKTGQKNLVEYPIVNWRTMEKSKKYKELMAKANPNDRFILNSGINRTSVRYLPSKETIKQSLKAQQKNLTKAAGFLGGLSILSTAATTYELLTENISDFFSGNEKNISNQNRSPAKAIEAQSELFDDYDFTGSRH